MEAEKNNISLSPLKITLIYTVVAGLWIAFTDRLLESLIPNPETLAIAQTLKGLAFVIFTGLGLYYLISRHDWQMKQKQRKVENVLNNLRSERELADILFERIPVLITIYDPELEEFEVNNEFEKVMGWSNEEIEHGEVDLLEACYRNLEEREEALEFMKNPGIGWKEFTMQNKSGEEVPTSWTNVKLTDNTSVGIGIDMTEIKASQAKIRESQKLLKKTFESLKSALILVDPSDRTIIDCNSGTEKLFGYERDEIVGSPTKMLHVDEQHHQKFDEMGEEALEKKGSFQTDFQMRKKDGTIFHTNHTVTLVYDKDDNVYCAVSVIRDITEQKEYEQQLEKRQERLLRSQQIGKIGDWDFDLRTEEISWSPMLYEIFERDPELKPPSLEKLKHEYFGSDSPKHNRALQKAIEEGKPYDIDLSLETERGNRKYIRAIAIPSRDEEGNTVRLTGIVQDITERKKTEKELERRKEFIETTLQNLPIGVAVNTIDDGRVTLMNDRFTKIYGWPKEVLTDVDSFFEHVYQDEQYRAEIREQVMTDMQSGDPNRMQWRRIPITTKEGEERIVNNRAIPLVDQNLMISTVIDVTEQHQLEKHLKLQNRKLEEAQEIARMGYWEYEIGSGNVPKWSDNLYRIYGLDPDEFEVTIEAFLDMVHPDDKRNFEEFIGEVVEKRFLAETFRLTKPNGELGYYHSRNELITDEEGNPAKILGIVHDITEIKQLEEEIIQSVIEAEDRERKRISRELHDGLGQYLVAANMNFQSMEKEVDKLPAKREKQFNTGLSLLKKALSETQSIAYNLMPKVITDYGLVTALENLIQDFRSSSDIKFEFTHNCEELELKNQAEINIYRIFQEVIANSVRHSECSRISIELLVQNDNLNIEIADNGKGIEAAEADNKGLGLRSIKTRVNSLNGSLEINSTAAEGTQTLITIPRLHSHQETEDTHG